MSTAMSRSKRSTDRQDDDRATPAEVLAGNLLRLAAAGCAIAGVVKVSQTGAWVFALVLVVPWIVVAVPRRPSRGVRALAVAVGAFELAIVGGALAGTGDGRAWFDAVVVYTALVLAPLAAALAGWSLTRD